LDVKPDSLTHLGYEGLDEYWDVWSEHNTAPLTVILTMAENDKSVTVFHLFDSKSWKERNARRLGDTDGSQLRTVSQHAAATGLQQQINNS